MRMILLIKWYFLFTLSLDVFSKFNSWTLGKVFDCVEIQRFDMISRHFLFR